MKVLITGANGQLGREWVDFCEQNSINFESFSSSKLDITREDMVTEQIRTSGPDVVINCAAYTKVDQAEDESEQAMLVNRKGAEILAKVCGHAGAKLIHYSTDYVFEGTLSDMETYPHGYPENAETNPINEYGRSKLEGEKAIQESGVEYLILRVSWLCGKHGSNFVKTMLKLGKQRDSLAVVNDQYGSPTFTFNVVKQSFELLKAGVGGIFHLSSEGMCTWYEFAREIFDQANIEVELSHCSSDQFPTKAKRPAFSKLSTAKIATIPGIDNQSWKQGLTQLLSELEL